MIITLSIEDEAINEISGKNGPEFVMREFRRCPQWFVTAAESIIAEGGFGKIIYSGGFYEFN